MGYWGVKNLGYGIWAPLCHPPHNRSNGSGSNTDSKLELAIQRSVTAGRDGKCSVEEAPRRPASSSCRGLFAGVTRRVVTTGGLLVPRFLQHWKGHFRNVMRHRQQHHAVLRGAVVAIRYRIPHLADERSRLHRRHKRPVKNQLQSVHRRLKESP